MIHETIKGVDISMLKEVESLGGEYFINNENTDIFDILRVNGVNVIRLRLWVDPYDEKGAPYLGGTNDLNTTIELAKRAKAQNMSFMLNLHYSDFWTDPKKQTKPKEWTSLTGEALINQVYDYTKNVLQICRDNDVMPDYIQIGNEITNGMLWPEGKTPTYLFDERKFEDEENEGNENSYYNLSQLLKAGIHATREMASSKHLKIILHLDFGGANDLYRRWFDEMSKYALDYDIIGLSYYPYWHGDLNELKFNLDDISQRYSKDVLIVETAYAFTDKAPANEDSIFNKELADIAGYSPSIQGQKKFLYDVMKTVQDVGGPHHKGLGIVYWEPAWLPVKGTSWSSLEGMKYGNDMANTGNHWANQGLFDFNGNALDSLKVFNDF